MTKQILDLKLKLITRHINYEELYGVLYYRSVTGELNYLEKESLGDISYIVHQCEIFVTYPKREHGDNVKQIGRYMRGTRIKVDILSPEKEKLLEVFCDADFAGN